MPAEQTLTRAELYELVWTTPIRTLAPRFGLSDVGLAKVCRRCGIPRPPVGYWAKVAHGKAVKQPPLPDAPRGVMESITFVEQPEPQEPEPYFDAELAALAERVESGEVVAPVRESLRGCHELTRRTREWLAHVSRPTRRDRHGILIVEPTYEATCVRVAVDKTQHHRALLILDAVLKTLDAIGVTQVPPSNEWRRFVGFKLRGVEFGIEIKERNRQVPHELTESEKEDVRRRGKHWGPKYDHIPTGELRLELTYARWGSMRAQFKDRKRSKLEEQIADVAMKILDFADEDLKRAAARREAELEAAEQARLEREEQARLKAQAERREAELARRKRLLELSECWHRRQELSRFIESCRWHLEHGAMLPDEVERFEQWLAWADHVCDRLNPHKDGALWLRSYTHGNEEPAIGLDA